MEKQNNVKKCFQKSINEKSKNQFLAAFGENIRELRLKRNMNQCELALKCHTNIRKIGRTERGEYDFKVSSLIILAKGLDLEVYELLKFQFPDKLYERIRKEDSE